MVADVDSGWCACGFLLYISTCRVEVFSAHCIIARESSCLAYLPFAWMGAYRLYDGVRDGDEVCRASNAVHSLVLFGIGIDVDLVSYKIFVTNKIKAEPRGFCFYLIICCYFTVAPNPPFWVRVSAEMSMFLHELLL